MATDSEAQKTKKIFSKTEDAETYKLFKPGHRQSYTFMSRPRKSKQTCPCLDEHDSDESEQGAEAGDAGDVEAQTAPSSKMKAETQPDVMHYTVTDLTSWSAFFVIGGTAWHSFNLWYSMFKAVMVSAVVAAVTFLCPGAELLQPDRFTKLGTFLNVFVGLLLGFFLSSSMNRWYASANSILELFDSVRKLQMQCVALGVAKKYEELLMRYGVLSAWLLHYELKGHHNDNHADARADMWSSIDRKHPHLIAANEREMLMIADEPCVMIWTWAASLIGRMAQDGEIPPMASPTYGRILNLVQMAYDSIRNIHSNVSVQTPFVYVHMLCILVHLNNVLNAVSFGLITGVTLSSIYKTHGVPHGTTNLLRQEEDEMHVHIARAIQALITSFFMSMVAPFLYQALLEVSVRIANPFQNKTARIPLHRLIAHLEQDLDIAKQFATKPPSWDMPKFKH